MYKLLLATDRPEIMNTFAAVTSWEEEGFKPPRIVSSAQGAMESLKKNHADGIAFALAEKEENILMAHLLAQYPHLPIFEATAETRALMESICELRSLLSRTHADFSDDSFGEADMMQLCRHEFFRLLLGGKIKTRSEVIRRLNLLRSRMDPSKPCVVLELAPPEGDSYLKGRWHYGADRLEVALRNFFGVELQGMRILASVLPDERMFLLSCPMLGEEIAEDDSLTGLVASHAEKSMAHVREYLDLDLHIANIRVLPGLTALAQDAQE